jgi:hypothetical protein
MAHDRKRAASSEPELGSLKALYSMMTVCEKWRLVRAICSKVAVRVLVSAAFVTQGKQTQSNTARVSRVTGPEKVPWRIGSLRRMETSGTLHDADGLREGDFAEAEWFKEHLKKE